MSTQRKNPIGWPQKQGLWEPSQEKDACGVGFVAHLKGERSHSLVKDALTMNERMSHRGACGCEPDSGDGAGIYLQMPDKFLRKKMREQDIELPQEGDYGAGIFFFSPETGERDAAKALVESIIREEGQRFLGWRRIPVQSNILGATARRFEPVMMQVFVGKGEAFETPLAFERKLYVIRRRVMMAIRNNEVPKHLFNVHGVRSNEFPGSEWFYICSLSARVMIYKGMLTPAQLSPYFPDLHDEDFQSALALVHSRFSTNTFPSWPRAHPNRFIAHNGEINTVMGNVNFMKAREALCKSDILGDDLSKCIPVVNEDGSDSARFDNVLEFLHLAGNYSLPHAIMMMIPEPWEAHTSMSPEKRAFYEYHATLMEPWDGPASITFSDGTMVGAVLDRNGLRPSRYYVTKDDRVIMASEVGVLPDIAPACILKKGRLQPGRMFLVNMQEGRIVDDGEIKQQIAAARPYAQWLLENRLLLEQLPPARELPAGNPQTLLARQRAFGYTLETVRAILTPTAQNGTQPIGSMGADVPLATLSSQNRLLYDYFKQIFAQVTNPPLDSIREELITATQTFIGSEANLLKPTARSCRRVRLDSPLIDNDALGRLREINIEGFKGKTLEITFEANRGTTALRVAMHRLFREADEAIESGVNILILSDRRVNAERAPIPTLLAMSGLHHHLVHNGTRTRVSVILETGEAREVHHFATLLGYGADAINPYLAFETILELVANNKLKGIDADKAIANYLKGSIKGVVKTMAKMGICTVASYRGAQIFEAIGISSAVINEFFKGTASRIEGLGLEQIAEEVLRRHLLAFPAQTNPEDKDGLENGGVFSWRRSGEHHLFNPASIHAMQKAVRENDATAWKEFADIINDQSKQYCTLRGLMAFRYGRRKPVPLEEVEPAALIVKRFKTGAMSYGSLSKEAHETIAIAMNRIGGKSNSGEGGEDAQRWVPLPNGDSARSAIKQVASGRFGVTSEYLVNADEIQIKIAQGAKPGEGGELPGTKVYPWIAKVRHSTPGVGLVSPPPHHDIYSIEDLAELIHDLKNANSHARINVKLVAEVGVGTIAAGVAKAKADVILISGHDGGTGASPLSSIHNAGAPWELGLAETNQILLLNNLRSRVTLETDGQLKTGRDVAIAALLGAEEFGFATAPLVSVGCLMMRVCHNNTCPVGIATQNPKLRAKFPGKPEHLINYMHFVAEELRQIMAELGFRSVAEMVGRVDLLETSEAIEHWKAKGVDLTAVFHQPDVAPEVGKVCQIQQDHGIEEALDSTLLLTLCKPALLRSEKVRANLPISNVNRVTGTLTGSEITRKYGAKGLPEDTIYLHFNGSAGQSFGAYCPPGMTLVLEGDANDYIGKGLSGAKIIVHPPQDSPQDFLPHENIIIGNVAFYGATSGQGYINGVAGERFAVRNCGADLVVEGTGDHGCEYMTGGTVTVLGKVGRNFAAGMSGGIAYVLDLDGDFADNLNTEMVNCYRMEESSDAEIADLKARIETHVKYTASILGQSLLDNWAQALPKFVKVFPRDYERMLLRLKEAEEQGLNGEEAAMAAFQSEPA